MKLLFDQNLSPALVFRLGDLFPESQHVFSLGMGNAPDGIIAIAEFADDVNRTLLILP